MGMNRSNSGRCPNCYAALPSRPAITPTGHRVCDERCVRGWMNGEEQLRYLKVVRALRALLAAA